MITYKKAVSTAVWISVVLLIWEAVAYIMKAIACDPLAEKKLPLISQIIESFSENGSFCFCRR